MSKNKSRDAKSSEIANDTLAPNVGEATASSDPLLEEVQQFLSRRAELASRLTQEIEATEKKLVDLKRTVAMLFPETESSTSSKDRKAKKPAKAKASTRTEKAESSEAAATVED